MNIVKIIGVFIDDRKYLVARDTDEQFFKNVGGRAEEGETDRMCLERHLHNELGFTISGDPDIIFDFLPTPAFGDPGDFVILRGYRIPTESDISFMPQGNTAELAWIDTQSHNKYVTTPQIVNLILPKLFELDLID